MSAYLKVKMMKWIGFLFLLCHLTCIHTMPKCCNGSNIFNGDCVDGGPLNIAECGSRILLDPNDNTTTYTTDAENNLIENGTVIAKHHYFCLTTYQEDMSEGILFCMDEEDLSAAETVRSVDTGFQFVSVFFIILTIWVYLIVPQMLDLQGICIIHSIFGLALAFVVLAIVNLANYLQPVLCHLLAYMMYFCFLYSFFWLNVLCFHIWRQVISPRIILSIQKWGLFYHLYGIGGPSFLLLFLIFVNHSNLEYFNNIHPRIAQTSCWFESERGRFIYFYGPISILLTINIILFSWTAITLWNQSKMSPKTKVLKYRLKLYLKLFFIMGISWIFEVISAAFALEEYKWIWYVTDALNALEGLIIFLILVVFRKKVIRSLADRTIFMFLRLPSRWKGAQDSECEEIEEEFSLSDTGKNKLPL